MGSSHPQAVAEATTSEVFARVLALPEADRADLAYRLLLSLEPEGAEQDADYEESWRAEIEARSRALAEGRATLLSREEVESRMREAIAQVRGSRPVETAQSS